MNLVFQGVHSAHHFHRKIQLKNEPLFAVRLSKECAAKYVESHFLYSIVNAIQGAAAAQEKSHLSISTEIYIMSNDQSDSNYL